MEYLIYIADDDAATRRHIKAVIEKAGYAVEAFETGDQLYIAFMRNPCSLIILDVMMPGNNGFVVCEMLREITDAPIIILSALDTDKDYINGISSGGNLYLPKPFSEARLIVHIDAMLKRPYSKPALPHTTTTKLEGENVLILADILIYPDRLTAYCNQDNLALTASELNLLVYMMNNQERAVSREELINKLWGADCDVSPRATDDIVKRVRKKLANANSQVYIKMVWGFGFRLNVNK